MAALRAEPLREAPPYTTCVDATGRRHSGHGPRNVRPIKAVAVGPFEAGELRVILKSGF